MINLSSVERDSYWPFFEKNALSSLNADGIVGCCSVLDSFKNRKNLTVVKRNLKANHLGFSTCGILVIIAVINFVSKSRTGIL